MQLAAYCLLVPTTPQLSAAGDVLSQVLTILVKADTIDVNVAASQRMTPTAWAAAADVFREQLQGVQLLSRKQVSSQCDEDCGMRSQMMVLLLRCIICGRQATLQSGRCLCPWCCCDKIVSLALPWYESASQTWCWHLPSAPHESQVQHWDLQKG